MSFDWSQYIELAENLISQAQGGNLDHALFRSSISRAYYGAFCLARNKVADYDGEAHRTDTHRYVRESFLDSTAYEAMQVGHKLNNLLRQRKNADYEAMATIDKESAERVLAMAKRTLDILNNENCTLDCQR